MAGWRLVCPISTPWHVLTAHGGSVITITLLGALTAHFVAARARRSWQSEFLRFRALPSIERIGF